MNKQEQPQPKRSNVGLLHCDCCGLAIDTQAGEDCPRCNYPISPPKEKQFLAASIRHLQRVATYEGANITVVGLIRRYQARLNYLDQLDVAPAPARPLIAPPSKVAPTPPTAKPSEIVPSPSPVLPPAPPVAPVEKAPEVVSPPPPVAPVARPARIAPATPSVSPVGKLPEIAPPAPPIAPAAKPARIAPATPSASPVGKSPEIAPPRPPVPPVVRPAGVAPASQPVVPAVRPTPAAPARERPSLSQLVFSWRSFLADQAITIVASLGAFLVLIGALSFIITAHNTALSFLIVFAVHTLFGIVGVSTYRFPNLRVVSRIYTGIYVLLVPLVGFAFYNLIHVSQLAPPVVIAIAAAYAAIVYSALAISQRFALFGYLGAMALVVTDLAVAGALHLGYWWWPSMLMLLALPALVSVGRPSGRQFFTGHLMVLRDPVRIFMFTIVGVCALGIIITTFYSLVLDGFGAPAREIRFSILSMMLLLSLWTSLYLWLTRRTKWVLVLVGLSLASVLAFCYAFYFEHIGYALALTGAALVYHGLSRFAPRLLQPFDTLGLRLDQLALVLVSIIPIISEPRLPLRLLSQGIFNTSFGLSSPIIWETVGELIAVGAGLMLTISVALSRAALRGPSGTPRNAWPWLLLLSGALLNWEYSTVVLALHAIPAWCFLGLTLVLVVGAIIVRQRFSSSWANPMDVLTLAEAILTLSLSLGQPDSLWALLLLSYGVVLYQRRQNWLFLPVAFALLAFPILIVTHRLQVILLMGILLPLAAAAVRRLMPANLVTLGSGLPTNWRVSIGWEWPLLVIAFLSAIIVSSFDVISSVSTVHTWLEVPFPVAVELATFSLAWYVSAALARVKWWLLPTIGFAIAALLLPSNPFWVLVGVTCASAALALGVSRFAGRGWASPLYIVTLLAALMTGIVGHTQHQLLATTWILLAFAVLVYIMGVVEDWTPWLWIMPVFAIWSLVDSAVLLGDLFRPPTVVLICAAAGVAIGTLRPFAVRRNRFVRYGLPFYTTAFVAAVLTGVYGTLAGVNNPFPGAVPVALLVYAVVAYGVLLFERRPWWLGLVAGFATWGILLATGTASYAVLGIEMTPASDVLAIGIALGVVGLLLSRVVKLPTLNAVISVSGYNLVGFSWSWPWYVTALVAAIVTGVFAPLPVAAWALLGFAVLFYIIGVVEDQVSWLWLAPVLVTWSRIDALLGKDLYGLFTVTLVSVALGVGIGVFKRFVPAFSDSARGNRLLGYALPFYGTALVSAVLTSIDGMLFGINQPFAGAIPAVLLLYAAIAYAVLLFERQPRWLALVAGFAIWGTLLALQTSVYYVFGIGIATGIAGLLLSRVVKLPTLNAVVSVSGYDLVKFSWSWPWYVTALVAAIVTGFWSSLPLVQPVPGFIEYGLLGFAVLFYIIGVVEDFAPCLWLAPALATWSRIDALLGNDLYGLFAVTLLSVALGVGIGVFKRFVPAFSDSRGNRLALPFYATALVSAVLTGIDGMIVDINQPFAGAIPAVLLLYAAIAYGVLLFERQPRWLALVTGFTIWGTLLALQTSIYYVFGIGIAAGIAGLLLGRVIKQSTSSTVTLPFMQTLTKLSWGWPWYVTALVAAIVTGVFAPLSLAAWALLIFAVLAYVIGAVDDFALCLWIAPVFATWSLIDSAVGNDPVRLITVTLVCAAAGMTTGVLNRIIPSFSGSAQGSRRLRYALPLYATALVAAMLTGIDGMIVGINQPFAGAIPAVLLLYTAVAYAVLLFERRPWWLGLVAGFAIWGTLLALQTNVYYVLAIGIVAGIAGLLLSRVVKLPTPKAVMSVAGYDLVKFSWGWPWYVTALVAAIVTGVFASLSVAAWALLVFAALAYIIGIAEDSLLCLWIAPVFATWSLIDSTLLHNFYRLPTVALACVALGVAIRNLTLLIPVFGDSTLGNRLLSIRDSLLRYALPFYAAALAAAVLTGIYGMLPGVNPPFYAAVTAALLLYAAVAYGVLRFEGRPKWLWLVAGFAIWGMLLAPQAVVIYWVVGVGIAAGLVGLLMKYVMRQSALGITTPATLLAWSWPWYLTALVAAAVTGVWPFLPVEQPVVADFIRYSLLAFMALSVVIMLVERIPEALVFPVGLGGLVGLVDWATGQHHWAPWQLMGAFSLLCVLLFASQFIWKVIPPATNWLPPTLLHRVFGLGGQALVVLIVIGRGGLSADAWPLAQVGAGALFLLALLLFWYGRLQNAMIVRRWCNYGAGLLISLVVPWELTAFRQTSFELLTLAPASYLIVVAPFLMRDESLPAHQRIGRVVSMLGSALLLLPTLWLSFSSGDSNQLYTLILLGESLVLLLLGLGMLVRIFVLAGAGLIVVAALHALFLSTSSTPLALTGLGMILLLVATGLALARRWLQATWSRWQ